MQKSNGIRGQNYIFKPHVRPNKEHMHKQKSEDLYSVAKAMLHCTIPSKTQAAINRTRQKPESKHESDSAAYELPGTFRTRQKLESKHESDSTAYGLDPEVKTSKRN